MDFLFDRLGMPRRLSSRLWLITLPSALVSFEKRSDVPKLPAKGSRGVGALLLVAAAGLGFLSFRQPNTSIAYEGPLSPVVRKPATAGGLLALGGIAFILRSTILALYAIALAAAAGTNRITIEDPTASSLLGREVD